MRLRDWVRSPAAASLLLFTAVGLGGFVAIGIGWRVAARTLFVPAQVPALVSGGFAGLALILIGAAFLTVQHGRWLAAQERAETDDLLDEAAALVEAFKRRAS